MKELILLVTLTLAFQPVKGAANTVGSVYCHNNHTVDITINNVTNINIWNESQWRLQQKAECEPTFSDGNVIYKYLFLPDCAFDAEQLPESIKYILKINAVVIPDPANTHQLRDYDHLYYVSCDYDNQNRSSASFVPIVNRGGNDSSVAYFTFSLQAFSSPDHTGAVPYPVALDQTLYLKAMVVTQSSTPNLDLFLERCWSSKSSDPSVNDGNFNLIVGGCGNAATSQDTGDTLLYNCTEDDIKETFSIRTYRYFGAAEGDAVYFHCDLRVCLADQGNSPCDCPTLGACPARKRRSIVDESQVYHVTSGPFTFESDENEEEVDKEKAGSDELEEDQSFPTTVAIIAVVSGIIAIAIVCATVYLIMRNRNKWPQREDPSVAT